ncbi:MAG: hypothetical protein KI793_14420 [Rivularia sp. (in: Bacteria)]|nr:hypothetical protein [Rivularia sp. MS3]
MSNWQETIGIIAGLLSLLGFIPYVVAIQQKKTQPNKATWCIWAIVGIILCTSYYLSGAINTIWVPLALAIGHVVIAILAFIYGKGSWNSFDKTCILGAAISLVLWWHYKSPLIALSINIAIDFLGALPTIRKSYREPETEDLLSWIIFLLAHTLNLIAIKQWSLSILAYPVYLFLTVATIVILLLRPKIGLLRSYYRYRRKRKSS